MNMMNGDWCDDCKLSVNRICAHEIRAKKIETCELKIDRELCVPLLGTPEICADKVTAKTADLNSACIASLNAPQACVQNLNATNAGISSLTVNDVCVSGVLRAANLQSCGKYRANVTLSTPIVYTLGTPVLFNAILDDPNSNVSLAPMTYSTPVSGYYSVSFSFSVNNFQPTAAGAILGTPIALAEVWRNGARAVSVFAPFLQFTNQQRVLASSLLQLNAGDLIQVRYRILALDSALGLIDVAGTVDVFGNGSDIDNSFFKIHLLSVTCTDLPCAPNIACEPCSPAQCTPCMPAANQRCCNPDEPVPTPASRRVSRI